MRFPQISFEWALFETGDMFVYDDEETALSPETLDDMLAKDDDEE